jgi:hypothetical protein
MNSRCYSDANDYNYNLLSLAMYTTYTCRESWYEYQRFIPSHLHSKEHYESYCKERALLYGSEVMVLMNNIVKINGWSWISGWSPQHNAESDGYIDVRTGKKYPNTQSIMVDIGK